MRNNTIILLFLGAGFVILYFLLQPTETNGGKTLKLDQDNDGVPDNADAEPNTLWLTDLSNYKLKDYISGDGTLDRTKVDKLCNCFEIANLAEREKIKCTDNAEYFVFEGKLWHYDSVSNRFLDKDGKKVRNGINPIGQFYQSLINKFKVPTPIPLSSENNKTVVITYNSKKYTVPQNLTSANGIVFNGADYRYYNNKWETRFQRGIGTWKTSSKNDITFVLHKIGKPIPDITEGSKIEKVSKNLENSDLNSENSAILYGQTSGNEADLFYKSFFIGNKPKEENGNWVKMRKNKDIISHFNSENPSPITEDGIKAEKIIKDYLKLNE